jgi:hypothetical protein
VFTDLFHDRWSDIQVVPPPEPTLSTTDRRNPTAAAALFDLRIVDPAKPDEYSEYLDGWSGLTASTDRRAPGQLSFDYPRFGTYRDLMRQHMVLAFLQDGEEGENCRYLLRNVDAERVSDGELMEGYQFASVWDGLRDATYRPLTEDSDAKSRKWNDFTAGSVLVSLMRNMADRGCFAWWGYQGLSFSEAADTNGNPWPIIDDAEFEYGQSAFEVWDWFIQNRWIEASSDGGVLNAYVPELRGKNRVTQPKPIILQQGIDIADAPEQTTWDDYVTDLTVIGGETYKTENSSEQLPRVYAFVSAPDRPFGRREKSITVTGVQKRSTLTKIGQKYMAGFNEPRKSRTYSVKAVTEAGEPLDVTPPAPPPLATPIPQVWSQYRTLVPPDRTMVMQGCVSDPVTGDFFVSSNEVDSNDINDLTWLRFNAAGAYQDQEFFSEGGHGDLAYCRHGDDGKTYLTFRHSSLSGSNDNSGTWVEVPYTAGARLTQAAGLAYATTAPARDPLGRRTWFQGEAFFDGYYYRMYGKAYDINGTTDSPAMPAFIERIRGGKITILSQFKIPQLGRVGMKTSGAPIDRRLEPEALSVRWDDGVPYLMVGMMTGTAGGHTRALTTYIYPLITETVGTVDPQWTGSPVPMIDYRIADTIGASFADGSPVVPEKIEIISATADSNDAGTYLITVGEWLDDRDAKIDRLLIKYGNG